MSLRRAAVIVEFEDGTRMIYEITSPVYVEFEERVPGSFSHPTYVDARYPQDYYLTVKGDLVRGSWWHDDMPTTQQQAVEKPMKGITP